MINILRLQISRWSLLLLLGDIAAFCLAIPVGLIVYCQGGKGPLVLFGPIPHPARAGGADLRSGPVHRQSL